MTDTPRLALPLIEPGQAQKELFHNEALLLLDAATQAVVASVGLDAPPAAMPPAGTCYALGAAPTGAWQGHPAALACSTQGGWRFVAPREGLAVWHATERTAWRFTEGAWCRGGVVVAPTGGGTVDTAARATLGQVLAVLRLHGLVPPG